MNDIGTREIATERLTLRRFEIEDAENMFYNWANDPEVTNRQKNQILGSRILPG